MAWNQKIKLNRAIRWNLFYNSGDHIGAFLIAIAVSYTHLYHLVDVQLNLLWVKTGEVDPRYFSIQANEVPGIPQTEYVNMYEHARRHPSQLTDLAKEAFQSIIEASETSHRTIYLVILQDVFYPFLELSEGRNWTMKSVRTGGLSFPTYMYVDQIDTRHRGVITLTRCV